MEEVSQQRKVLKCPQSALPELSVDRTIHVISNTQMHDGKRKVFLKAGEKAISLYEDP